MNDNPKEIDEKVAKKKNLSEKQKTIRALRRLVVKLIILGAMVTALLIFVGGIHVSHDNNMFPAINDGDLSITYKLGGYYNGDIVVYEAEGKKRFGRVVGIPGDVIDIAEEGRYTVNGVTPYETIYFQTRPAEVSKITYPYQVKEGEVFILNDLRENTNDSRVYGGIAELKGKVVLLIRRRGF